MRTHSNIRALHVTVNKSDLTPEMRKETKLAKKRNKELLSVQEGEKETIRRNICQAVDVPLSQMSDYESGLKTDSRGIFFDFPEEVNIMEAQNNSDTDSD